MKPIRTIALSEVYTASWGKQGENNAVQLSFDLKGWANAWPDGAPAVAFRRADGKEYAHTFKREGNTLIIPVLDYDNEVAGLCAVVISWIYNGNETRSVIINGRVNASIVSIGETPAPPELGIIEQVNKAAARAEAAADRAESSGGGGSTAPVGNGGYYTPSVTQPESNVMTVSFEASKAGMPSVAPVSVMLPKGETGAQGEKGDPGKGLPDVTADDAGKLLYMSPSGEAAWLSLGPGLKIVDGVLILNITTGENVSFTANSDGSITMNVATFIWQDDGSVLLDGAQFSVQDDGSVLVN